MENLKLKRKIMSSVERAEESGFHATAAALNELLRGIDEAEENIAPLFSKSAKSTTPIL